MLEWAIKEIVEEDHKKDEAEKKRKLRNKPKTRLFLSM
jgi:hypothetical protein